MHCVSGSADGSLRVWVWRGCAEPSCGVTEGTANGISGDQMPWKCVATLQAHAGAVSSITMLQEEGGGIAMVRRPAPNGGALLWGLAH